VRVAGVTSLVEERGSYVYIWELAKFLIGEGSHVTGILVVDNEACMYVCVTHANRQSLLRPRIKLFRES